MQIKETPSSNNSSAKVKNCWDKNPLLYIVLVYICFDEQAHASRRPNESAKAFCGFLQRKFQKRLELFEKALHLFGNFARAF